VSGRDHTGKYLLEIFSNWNRLKLGDDLPLIFVSLSLSKMCYQEKPRESVKAKIICSKSVKNNVFFFQASKHFLARNKYRIKLSI
jgi:hypothetical protein